MSLMFWFFIKHFICDFPLQAFPWMYNNKGTYGHLGGIVHALIHGIGTFIILFYLTTLWTNNFFSEDANNYYVSKFWCLVLFDIIVHYHIDWAKMNINKMFNWKSDNSEMFWILLGVDQLLHYLTYLVIIYFII